MGKFDIIVVGSGPGGYVAAVRAAQLGKSVAVIERSEIGGICLNWGCIPTKALLKSAQAYTYARHAAEYGFEASDVKADITKMVERSHRKDNEYFYADHTFYSFEDFQKQLGLV